MIVPVGTVVGCVYEWCCWPDDKSVVDDDEDEVEDVMYVVGWISWEWAVFDVESLVDDEFVVVDDAAAAANNVGTKG